MTLGIHRNWQDVGVALAAGGKAAQQNPALPIVSLSLQALIEKLKLAYKATTNGKFSEAHGLFSSILQAITLTTVTSRENLTEVRWLYERERERERARARECVLKIWCGLQLKELLGLCREYITGIRIELARKELQTANQDPVRQCELAAYFSHCNLQPIHLMLSLRSAMNCTYKIKNFRTAGAFARRLLELNPKQELAVQAKKVVAFCEKNDSDTERMNYDERNPFVVCALSLVPIYRGSPLVACPYCGSSFLPEHKGKVCRCGLQQQYEEQEEKDEGILTECV